MQSSGGVQRALIDARSAQRALRGRFADNPNNHTTPTQPHNTLPEFLHVKPGKGAAFVRSKLKNLLTGNSNERTFRAGEMLNVAEVNRREGQFTYAEGDNVRRDRER